MEIQVSRYHHTTDLRTESVLILAKNMALNKIIDLISFFVSTFSPIHSYIASWTYDFLLEIAAVSWSMSSSVAVFLRLSCPLAGCAAAI